MKNTTKVGILMLAIALVIGAGVSSVSAKVAGEGLEYFGIALGAILLVAALILIAAGAIPKILTGKAKGAAVVIGIAFLVAGAACYITVSETEVLSTVESITWDVTAVSGSSDMTIDNDARTITKLIGTFASGSVINGTDDDAWVAGTDDPVINFTISPSLPVGVSETTNQGTTTCIVNDPDQKFTEDSSSYYLFELVSTGGDRNLAWTTDGTTDYESKLCTVTIGSSEVAQLTIHLLDDGLCLREAGDSNTFTISIGGITYTMTVIVTILHTG